MAKAGSERCCSALAEMSLQERVEVLRAQSMNVFTLTNCPFQTFDGGFGGEVEDGSGERGDRDPSPCGDLVWVELRTMPADCGAGSCRARDRDLYPVTPAWALDPP
jgi:hypothetical protein